MRRNNAAKTLQSARGLRGWSGAYKRLLPSFIYTTLRCPPEQRLFLEHERAGQRWKPSVSAFHVVIRTTIWDPILHKYTDLQRLFSAPLPCSRSHFDSSTAALGAGEGQNSPHWFLKEGLYSHFLSSRPRWEVSGAELPLWGIITFDLHGEITGAGWGSFSPPPHIAVEMLYLICIQTTRRLHHRGPRGNQHSDKDFRGRKLPASMFFKS